MVSEPLKRLLHDTGASDLAVEHIVSVPALHEEAKAILPALKAHAAPCGPQAVMMQVGRLFAIWPQPARSEAEWETFWEFYIDDLADLPLDALIAGIRDARRSPDAEFLPKPGPLRALALKHAEPIHRAAYRIERAARAVPPKPFDKGDAEARKAQVAAVLAEIKQPRPDPRFTPRPTR